MMPKYILSIGLLLLVAGGFLRAQNVSYPVTAVVQSLPPFTGNMSEWVDPINNRLQATLLLNDREEPGYQVRLRVTVEGAGITLQTNMAWQPRPIALTYGVPVQLSAMELSEYFSLDHLDFLGYSRQAYLENGGLPDGTYSICIEVLDYDRFLEDPASRKTCSIIQARLLDPPVVLNPIGYQTPVNPQQLLVQWQARHTASFMTRYRVEMYQIDPESNLTPEQIYTFQQPYIETELDGLTATIIDATFPPLEVGFAYLLRVQAQDPMGNSVFRNSGYSEPVIFEYGSACPPPSGFTAEVNSYESATLGWNLQAGVGSYVVRFREQNPYANWYEQTSIFNDATLDQLIENTTYEVQVQSVCNGSAGAFGPVYTFTTEEMPFTPPSGADCTVDVDELERPANQEPLTLLEYSDTVIVGGFQMRVFSATPDEGSWTGTGQIYVNWLGKRINCKFINLYVNTDYEVYDGTVVAEDEGLTSLPGYQSPDDIAASLQNQPLNFCGDSITIAMPDSVLYDGGSFYASGNPIFYGHYIPYDPNQPSNFNEDFAYNQYNPNNPELPYSATDYNNSRNPYTPENPFDPNSIWNPWNNFNTYDYSNYDDPVNPYSEAFPWSPEVMFEKQGLVTSANDGFWIGGEELPVAIGEGENLMAIYGMRFSATGAFLNAYFAGMVPMANRYMAFQAIGAGFNTEGIQGETKMKMMTDLTFSWTDKMELTFKKGNYSYVKFDCQGINEVSIDLSVRLCQDVAIPIDPETFERDSSGYVTASATIVSGGWGDFSTDISLTPFEFPYLEGWTVEVENAVFDFSEVNTPSSVTFPLNYEHPDFTITDPAMQTGSDFPTWRGFYLGATRIKVPDHLTGRDSVSSVTFSALNLIVDQTGFSGDITAENLISLEEGRLDTWDFAVDTIAIGAQSNQFHHVNIGGKVKLPPLDSALIYRCHIQPNSRYNFSVTMLDSLQMSCMAAQVVLDSNTTIGINYRASDRTISANAILHGSASFGPRLRNNANNPPPPQGLFPEPTEADTTNNLKVPNIRFDGFHIITQAPYVQEVGTWNLDTGGDQASAAGFPITVNQSGIFQNEDGSEVAFGGDITLNLSPNRNTQDTTANNGDNANEDPASHGFSANSRFFIITEIAVNETTGKQEWSFKRVRLDKFAVDYEGPGFAFRGYVENYDTHPVYGTGFRGGLQAEFKPGISVAVAATFGKVDGYRYFFADALIAFEPGLAIGASGLAVYGFGGGVSYRMERQGIGGIELPYSEATSTEEEEEEGGEGSEGEGSGDEGTGEESADGEPDPDPDPDLNPDPGSLEENFANGQDPAVAFPPKVPLPDEIGVSLSGVTYVPNPDIGIGIKAMVAFGAIKREVFNGDITFEIIFNQGGGLSYIGFLGNANFMTPPRSISNPSPQPSVAFFIDLGYDFNNEAFDAYMRLQVAAPPGRGLIRGSYPNFVAGEGKIHADADDWYIYLGTPDQPVSLSLDLSALKNLKKEDGSANQLPAGQMNPLNANSINNPLGQLDQIGLILTAYFNAGTILPPFPGPPAIVADILNLDELNLNITSRDDPVFANASGILLGASAQLNMPDLRFLIFYAGFTAGAGFDVMLKNYGLDARCANNLDSEDPIGFNGWYATGQLYGYVEGEIGIRIRLGLFKIDAKILEIGAAALLQARLPNPLWAQGIVGGRFSILNGLISGQCQFDFEIGEECVIVPSGSEDIRIVESLVPDADYDEVSVFTRPQAIFNMPIGIPTPFLDEDDSYVYIKPELTSFIVRDVETTEIVQGTLEWNSTKTVVAFRPDDVLGGNREYSILTTVQAFQGRSLEGPYVLMNIGGNAESFQVDSETFFTSEAPDYIVEDNVSYAYPVNRQTNFFRYESGQGYIQLAQGQDYLFASSPDYVNDPAEWEQKIRFSQNGVPVFQGDYSYNTEDNRVNFAIPSGSLEPSTVYYYELLDIPAGMNQAVDANIDSLVATLEAGGVPDDNTTEVLLNTQEAGGTLEGSQVKEVYRLDFRTSQFDDFAAKIGALNQSFTFNWIQALTEPLDEEGNDIPYLSIDDFGVELSSVEGLDRFDLEGSQEGSKELDPLYQVKADLNVTGEDWYVQHPKPNIYDLFPWPDPALDLELSWRDSFPYEYPPRRAVFLKENSTLLLRELTQFDIDEADYSVTNEPLVLRYHLPYITYRDHADFKNQLWGLSTDIDLPAQLNDYLEWDFVYPFDGNYKVELDYILPGATSPNSTVSYLIPYVFFGEN